MDINAISLDSLPSAETDDLEYKSSRTPDDSLTSKIQKAASAFWNSGGGLFLAGIDDKTGKVDGGIAVKVGKQSRQDWLSRILSAVHPQAEYKSRLFSSSEHPDIRTDHCVLAIEFSASSALPHQSADKKYYIRAGAHTEPASHFLVEALYAKRHFRKPKLAHLVGMNFYTGSTSILHVEVIAATDAVALNVEIDFDPRPTVKAVRLPITVPLIDREHPFSFRFEVSRSPSFKSKMRIKYEDFTSTHYADESMIDMSRCLPPENRDSGELGALVDELREIKQVLVRNSFRAQYP